MSLVRDAEIVCDTRNSHEFFSAGLNDVCCIVGVNVFRYAKNRECVQECDDCLNGRFVLGRMEHNESGSLFLHEKNFRGAGELACLRDRHVVAVPSAKERCA